MRDHAEDKTKSAVQANPPAVTINISFPEHKTEGSSKWLTAVGAALSGLAATWAAVKPPPPPLPPPAPGPIVDQDHKPPVIASWKELAAAASTQSDNVYAEYYTITPDDIEPLVHTLAASHENRMGFVGGFRRARPAVAPHATEGEQAISTLFDLDQDTGHRVAAALYLGGHAKREYISPLKAVSRQDDIVGIAAGVALDMLHEQLDYIAPTPAYTLPGIIAPDFPKE
jgi:hypothetical protein